MTNIAKLLKDAPKGMTLYSPLLGEVKFKYINGSKFGIVVEDSEECCRSFDKYGRYFTIYDNAECLLFPSRDCRTWEGWKLSDQPKFKADDWLVYKDGGTFAGGSKNVQVKSVEDGEYIFTHNTNGSHRFIDENCRLWSIADATDGDVLATDGIICIFKKLDKDGYYIISPCIYTVKDGLEVIDDEDDSIGSCGFKPATKEDRELLFRKMKEAGYTWDKKNNKLRKITESQFKVGNWIIFNNYFTIPIQIIGIREKDNIYVCKSIEGIDSNYSISSVDSNYHLWTIQDAKDGDVLVTDFFIFLFKKVDNGNGVHYYCHCGVHGEEFDIALSDSLMGRVGNTLVNYRPATKEQRDLLFAKMREAGYEWDEKKKELKKIKVHYDISNFHAGMPVLVRDRCHECWNYVLFSHYRKDAIPFCAGGQYWYQCIPFNEETKHLLGTTDMPSEEYINW